MAQVKLSIAGRSYDLACRPGEEAHFVALARVVDAKAQEAQTALGGMSEVRTLLLAALLLADDLTQKSATAAPAASEGAQDAADDGLADAIATLAERLESLADALEKAPAAS